MVGCSKTGRALGTLVLVIVAGSACAPGQPPAVLVPLQVDDELARIERERVRLDSMGRAAALPLSVSESPTAAGNTAEEAENADLVSLAREVLAEPVLFEYDSESLTPRADEAVRLKAAILRANPGVSILIEGHADERGTTEYNLALGQRRAEALRDHLIDHSIERSRIETISYGKERPAARGVGEHVWSRNRRGEFKVVSGEISSVAPTW